MNATKNANFIKTPIFLFRENLSRNRQGNYFDGEDPYRENWYEFYSIGNGGKIIREKQIYMITDWSYGTPDVVNAVIETFYGSFCEAHSGHTVIVLGIECSGKPIRDRVDDSIRRYMKDHRSHKILPAYKEG